MPPARFNRTLGQYARFRRIAAFARSATALDRRAAYLGWLNHRNMGDEAMFAAYQRALPNCVLVEVPERILRWNGAARRLAETRAIVLGGGTLIGRHAYREAFARLKAAAPDAPAVMIGTGVEDPDFHGRAKDEMCDELRRWSEILHDFDAVDVRGPRSVELLEDVGVSARVVGDPALMLGPRELGAGPADKVLGINLSLSMQIWGDRPDRVLQATSEAVQDLAKSGWRIRYVPMWPEDIESGHELRRASGVDMEILDDFLDLDALLRGLAGCRVFVGQKLHSVVLASAVHTPSVMVEYHPKCRDFQRSVDRERWTLRTDAITRDAVTGMVLELDETYAEQRRTLHKAVNDLRGRLAESAARALRALPATMR